jgi:hypothetical protein
MLTPEKIQKLKILLPWMTSQEKRETLADLDRWEREMTLKMGQDNLLAFADHVYPGYKVGPHHKRLAKIFEDIANGKKKTGNSQYCASSREVRAYFVPRSGLVLGQIPS